MPRVSKKPKVKKTGARGLSRVQIKTLRETGATAAKVPSCPTCGSPMRQRSNRKTGRSFWGCSRYPRCKGYRPYSGGGGGGGGGSGSKIKHPSKYQQAIFDWVQYGKGNATVEAVPGSGKTTTAVHVATLIPNPMEALFVAFNKHIADELRGKLPIGFSCGTFHSVCLRAIKKQVPGVQIDQGKMRTIIKGFMDADGELPLKIRPEVSKTLMRLGSLCKATLTEPNDKSAMENLLGQYGIVFTSEEHEEAVFRYLPEVLEYAKNMKEVIDFDDMIWHIYVHDYPTEQYKWVVVDEAQDLNRLQMEVVQRFLCKGNSKENLVAASSAGRALVVGDRYQSIYGFRGAHTQAIPLLIACLKSERLPLNICYRCPRKHVELAQRLVPEIEPWEQAKPGVVEHYTEAEAKKQLKDGDMVLCRTNAPLVSLCLDLIRSGRKATIKGRDIGASLVSLIEMFRVSTLPELLDALDAYRTREVSKLINKGQDSAAQLVDDRCGVIQTIASRPEMETIGSVVDYIQNLFADDEKEGIICSSVHRAKGLEAETVFILHPHLMPSSFAKTEEDIQQEKNVEYVALTRSKNFLGFIQKAGC